MYICDECNAVFFEPVCRCSTAEFGDITAHYFPMCGEEPGNPDEHVADLPDGATLDNIAIG
nr:MAG TPA: Rubredoxin metal binding domain [Caudoviricetes sp.]